MQGAEEGGGMELEHRGRGRDGECGRVLAGEEGQEEGFQAQGGGEERNFFGNMVCSTSTTEIRSHTKYKHCFAIHCATVTPKLVGDQQEHLTLGKRALNGPLCSYLRHLHGWIKDMVGCHVQRNFPLVAKVGGGAQGGRSHHALTV